MLKLLRRHGTAYIRRANCWQGNSTGSRSPASEGGAPDGLRCCLRRRIIEASTQLRRFHEVTKGGWHRMVYASSPIHKPAPTPTQGVKRATDVEEHGLSHPRQARNPREPPVSALRSTKFAFIEATRRRRAPRRRRSEAASAARRVRAESAKGEEARRGHRAADGQSISPEEKRPDVRVELPRGRCGRHRACTRS